MNYTQRRLNQRLDWVGLDTKNNSWINWWVTQLKKKKRGQEEDVEFHIQRARCRERSTCLADFSIHLQSTGTEVTPAGWCWVWYIKEAGESFPRRHIYRCGLLKSSSIQKMLSHFVWLEFSAPGGIRCPWGKRACDHVRKRLECQAKHMNVSLYNKAEHT